MHRPNTVFKGKNVIKLFLALILLEILCLVFRSNLLSSYRLFYLLVFPFMVPFLIAESKNYLCIPELISRSNRPVKYFILSHERRILFLMTYAVILSIFYFMNSVFEQNNSFLIGRFIVLIFVIFCIGALISSIIDLALLATKQLAGCLLIVFSVIGLDYLLAEIGYTCILYSCIFPIVSFESTMKIMEYSVRFSFILLPIIAISFIMIYFSHRTDSIQHPREAV